VSESYGYILAELLKHNTNLHGRELVRHGKKQQWINDAKKIVVSELRQYPHNGELKAFSGLLWKDMKQQGFTTRHIYQLLLQWALELTKETQLYFYTQAYEDLFIELRHTIESGAGGVVKDILPEEIINEWEAVKDYLVILHGFCEQFMKRN
jgi:hypothetical protein